MFVKYHPIQSDLTKTLLAGIKEGPLFSEAKGVQTPNAHKRRTTQPNLTHNTTQDNHMSNVTVSKSCDIWREPWDSRAIACILMPATTTTTFLRASVRVRERKKRNKKEKMKCKLEWGAEKSKSGGSG